MHLWISSESRERTRGLISTVLGVTLSFSESVQRLWEVFDVLASYGIYPVQCLSVFRCGPTSSYDFDFLWEKVSEVLKFFAKVRVVIRIDDAERDDLGLILNACCDDFYRR